MNETGEIFLPFKNITKVTVTLKIGSILGTYQKLDEEQLTPISQTCSTTRIQNDLIPYQDVVDTIESRKTKLHKSIKDHDWSHLCKEEQDEMQTFIRNNDEVFMVDAWELGKITTEHVHIGIQDVTPVRM